MSQNPFTKFGESIASTIDDYFPALAKNALKIELKTEAQIVSETTKTHVGLGNVQNLPVKKAYTNGETLLATSYTVPRVVKGIVDYLLVKLQGTQGKIVYAKTKTQMDVEMDLPIQEVAVCTGPTERDTCLTSKKAAVVYERNEHRLWTLSNFVYTEVPQAQIINYIKPNRWYVNMQLQKLYYAVTPTLMVKF